ncbi:MAG: hypothetical protein AseanaTS_13370 [Candidatus Pelagadaptatus aseana]
MSIRIVKKEVKKMEDYLEDLLEESEVDFDDESYVDDYSEV